MKIQTIANDQEHCLLSVGCNHDLLTWKAYRSDEKYLLIVRSGFSRDEGIKKCLIRGLETKNTLVPGEEFPLPDGMTAYFYEKGEIAGYFCAVKPARYTVFICGYTAGSNEITLYTDSKSADISTEIKLTRRVYTEKTGFIWKREVKTIVSFSLDDNASMPIGYIDGALYYQFTGINYKFPVSAEMLKTGFTIPIRNSDIPKICSNFMGFTGTITHGG